MAKEYAKTFYRSTAWEQCRLAYLSSVGNLCERCLANGEYNPAKIVHHKIYITPENINNPSIILDHNNLEALCQECHNKEHNAKNKRRYRVDHDGNLIF